MRYFIFLTISFMGLSTAVAKPPELMPEHVCKSIDSDKYEAQCSSIVKDGYFDKKVFPLCLREKGGYEKMSCMNVIRGKTYLQSEVDGCLKDKEVGLLKCLQFKGEPVKEVETASDMRPEIQN